MGVAAEPEPSSETWPMHPGVQHRTFGRAEIGRQRIFGVERAGGIARGQNCRVLPPAVAALDACEQTFALLTWTLRYHCLPCWDAFCELDEDAECVAALAEASV